MIRHFTIKNLLFYTGLLFVAIAFGNTIFPVHMVVQR